MSIVDLGFLALKRGDYQEAVNIFKRVLDSTEEAEPFFGLGVAHYYLSDLPTARWALNQALKLKHDYAEAQIYLIRIEQERNLSKPESKRESRFRALRDSLEIRDGTWRKFFVKGVNIGLGLPGYFPGEYAVKKGTYLKWFKQIKDLGANAIRVYTVLPPEFYESLHQFNSEGMTLYLFQEIWTELPAGNDFEDKQFTEDLSTEIKNAVDAIYGNAVLPEQPGRPHGRYEYDVSSYVAGFIIGREWESCAVKAFNEIHQRKTSDYLGDYLQIRNGSPFEVWVAKTCDYLQKYEFDTYHCSHPVTTVNWPTLDPLTHPSESSYEEEYKLQGLVPEGFRGPCIDVHIEDEETLDLAKITPVKGNGFFAVYHAYPYYPDFMNNDYADRENPYLDYLLALKKHHGHQPVIVAEFGVPSSREVAHWHRLGWHHGGHSDREQGEINGLQIKAIHKSGMAGGILFSWFDEWFKRNWLFLPAELPANRKAFWYNFQDPEENYGLLAAYPGYPGKKVNLTCSAQDWQDVAPLYEKKSDSMVFRFDDGGDEARRLVRLSAQHDEGFLYLLLETAGSIDFKRANFLIGLDTCMADTGERMLPFETSVTSPVGLTFLIHLGGTDNSRILVAAPYDKYLNSKTGRVKPEASDQGAWVMMQNETNIRRISKDGKRFFPAHVFTMSRLRFGSLDPKNKFYSSLADFFYHDNRVELRIPWGLINITDPSSKTVLWMDENGTSRTVGGVRLLALSYKPHEGNVSACRTNRECHNTDSLPAEVSQTTIRTYTWENWHMPIFHTYLKESYYRYQKILRSIPEAR